MSFTVTRELLTATQTQRLQEFLKGQHFYARQNEAAIPLEMLDEDSFADLAQAAESVGDRKVLRAIESMRAAAAGDFTRPLPNFKPFQYVLTKFLQHDLSNGWIFRRARDGHFHPELVTGVTYTHPDRSNNDTPRIYLRVRTKGLSDRNRGHVFGVGEGSHTFEPSDVAKRTIVDILSRREIYHETAILLAENQSTMERFNELIHGKFAFQFRFSGVVTSYEKDDHSRRGMVVDNRKVVHDGPAEEFDRLPIHVDSDLFTDTTGVGEVPIDSVMRVFDLLTQESYWVHGDDLTPYVYDTSLRDKLVLPDSHRELLDMLTVDYDDMIDDLVEGKHTSNVVLCKGPPGVGKTLTAEVYAELIGRPLLKINAGTLGVEPAKIRDALTSIFRVAERFNVVLLLDECDVFVARRGNNITQNAICAEFLTAFESFSRLMFATTNRADDVDDAFMQRCACVIDYVAPERDLAAKVWLVMAEQFNYEIDASLRTALLDSFPGIAQRDIRELLRTTLRMAKKRGVAPSIDLFRHLAVFRGVKIHAP